MQLQTVLCPSCRSEMVTQRRHGVEVDLCPCCRGMWLDRGELDRIVERSERFDEQPVKESVQRRRRDWQQEIWEDGFEAR